MTRFCPQGHENPETNRFCQQCGTQISVSVTNYLTVGTLLGDRYRITAEIGQGGFGRTYLCKDINRFDELCVLKEFAPQVQGTALLSKAQALFEREAGVMYQLQHPQIPMFREMFRANREGIGQLFLIQDYVAGTTYQALLRQKLQHSQKFTEPEITEFLIQILPVLSYIHALGVIHRDISPDNLIKRDRDGLPVLIDFGGVKQVAVNAATQYMSVGSATSDVSTRLGKIGYAPNEQMQRGVVFPHSDLYALAATAIVLLTGKEPPDLIDPQNFTWNWREYVNLSDRLASILDRMLQLRPKDRFQTAEDVLTALKTGNLLGLASDIPLAATINPVAIQSPPATVAAGINRSATPQTVAAGLVGIVGKTWLAIAAIATAIGLGWLVASKLSHSPKIPIDVNSNSSNNSVGTPIATTTTQPKTPSTVESIPALPTVLKDKGVNRQVYGAAIAQIYASQHPGSKSAATEAQLNTLATELGNKLIDFNPQALKQIGKYKVADRATWKTQVNQVNLSQRALTDLTNAKYRTLTKFIDQKLGSIDEKFLASPLGQIYLATMFDRVQAIQSKQAIAEIVFPIGEDNSTVSGTLQSGEGMAYIANLSGGQDISVNITTNQPTALAIYPPSSNLTPILTLSPTKNWSGKTSVNGNHEIVLVSQSDRPLTYQLKLTAATLF